MAHSENIRLSKSAWQSGACRRKLLLSHILRLERVDATRARWRGRLMAELLAAWYRLLMERDEMPSAPVRAALVRLIAWGDSALDGAHVAALADWLPIEGSTAELLGRIATLAELKVEEDAEDGERRILGVLGYALLDAEEVADRCGGGEAFVADAKQRLEAIAEVFAYYVETHTDDLARFEVEDVECWLDLPILTPTGRPSPNKTMGARLDLLVRDRATGRLEVREFKTTSATSDLAAAAQGYMLDPQAAIQVMAVETTYGERPAFSYVVIWAGVPRVPGVVQCRAAHTKMASPSDCTKCGGGKQAVSTQAIATTAEIYEEAVRALGLDPYADPDYSRVLEGLRGRAFSLEVPRQLTDADLAEVMAEAYEVATTHLRLMHTLRRFERDRGMRLTALETLGASRLPATGSGLPDAVATSFYRNSAVCGLYGGCEFRDACLGCEGWQKAYVVKASPLEKREARLAEDRGPRRETPAPESAPEVRENLRADATAGYADPREADIPF